MTLKFLKLFGPYILIVGLVMMILIQRNTITGKTAKLEAAEVANAQLTEANKANVIALNAVRQQRIDNDAIAEAVAAKLTENGVRETNTRTIIEREVRNDPKVRAWGDTAVPDSLRRALRADQVRKQPR